MQNAVYFDKNRKLSNTIKPKRWIFHRPHISTVQKCLIYFQTENIPDPLAHSSVYEIKKLYIFKDISHSDAD